MQSLKADFLKKTKMVDVNGETTGVEKIFEYLIQPNIVYLMITASELELPVLTLIAKDLEKNFGKDSKFPIADPNKPVYRQNVGRMIKKIMGELGYTPIDGGLSERARIPAVSGADIFLTSGIYAKTAECKFKLYIVTQNKETGATQLSNIC